MRATLWSIRLLSIILVAIPALLIAPAGAAADLSIDERIAYRRALEAVYQQHRNGSGEVPEDGQYLSRGLPDQVLRKKIENSLLQSDALETRWNRPITSADLQAELDRMVRETKAPDMLEELFESLDHDPLIIVEVLVRPLLADRLVREAFDSDREIHAPVRRLAISEHASLSSLGDMRKAKGSYREVERIRQSPGTNVFKQEPGKQRLYLDPVQWEEKIAWLENRIGDLPTGAISDLHEDSQRFSALAVLEREEGRLQLALLEWPKQDFEQWWSTSRDQFSDNTVNKAGSFQLQQITAAAVVLPDSWVNMGTTGGHPSARSHHTAVWTGSEMIIWGGDDGIGYSYSGSRYDPATSVWTAMTNIGHPSGRVNHTAVWIPSVGGGGMMVIWGGSGVKALTNTGGRYDPATNSWQTTSTTGTPPSARAFHTAVTLRNRMVVWGGWDGSSHLGDGFEYDPFNDTWSSIVSKNAPSARSRHSAVVYRADSKGMCGSTSTAMVIFGGEDATGALGTGAYFCLNSFIDLWLPLSLTGAPSARTGHSAIATSLLKPGNEMIIWGGHSGTSVLQNGARWEWNVDAKNVWKSLSVSNRPSARQGHRAVWIDDVVMIWGGYSGSTLRNTGALYNPANNLWMPVTTTNAPSARKNHSALMLKFNMYVWGGNDGAPTATGAGYVRPTDFILSATSRLVKSVPGGAELNALRAELRGHGGFDAQVILSHTAFPGSLMIWNTPLQLSSYAESDIDVFVDAGATLGDRPFYLKAISDSPSLARNFAITLRLQDFQIACDPGPVSIAPGGSAQVNCSISSQNSFNDPVTISCTSGSIVCSASESPVTPPEDGTVDVQMAISVGAGVTPGSYSVIPTAQSHLAERFSSIQVIVTNPTELIFDDSFE